MIVTLLASSRPTYDNGTYDISLGLLFFLGGAIFWFDAAGLGTRWQGSRFGRRPAESPEQQRKQDQLLRYRHLVTMVIGLALVVFGLFHL